MCTCHLRVVSHAERLELVLRDVPLDKTSLGELKRRICSSSDTHFLAHEFSLRFSGKSLVRILRERQGSTSGSRAVGIHEGDSNNNNDENDDDDALVLLPLLLGPSSSASAHDDIRGVSAGCSTWGGSPAAAATAGGGGGSGASTATLCLHMYPSGDRRFNRVSSIDCSSTPRHQLRLQFPSSPGGLPLRAGIAAEKEKEKEKEKGGGEAPLCRRDGCTPPRGGALEGGHVTPNAALQARAIMQKLASSSANDAPPAPRDSGKGALPQPQGGSEVLGAEPSAILAQRLRVAEIEAALRRSPSELSTGGLVAARMGTSSVAPQNVDEFSVESMGSLSLKLPLLRPPCAPVVAPEQQQQQLPCTPTRGQTAASSPTATSIAATPARENITVHQALLHVQSSSFEDVAVEVCSRSLTPPQTPNTGVDAGSSCVDKPGDCSATAVAQARQEENDDLFDVIPMSSTATPADSPRSCPHPSLSNVYTNNATEQSEGPNPAQAAPHPLSGGKRVSGRAPSVSHDARAVRVATIVLGEDTDSDSTEAPETHDTVVPSPAAAEISWGAQSSILGDGEKTFVASPAPAAMSVPRKSLIAESAPFFTRHDQENSHDGAKTPPPAAATTPVGAAAAAAAELAHLVATPRGHTQTARPAPESSMPPPLPPPTPMARLVATRVASLHQPEPAVAGDAGAREQLPAQRESLAVDKSGIAVQPVLMSVPFPFRGGGGSVPGLVEPSFQSSGARSPLPFKGPPPLRHEPPAPELRHARAFLLSPQSE